MDILPEKGKAQVKIVKAGRLCGDNIFNAIRGDAAKIGGFCKGYAITVNFGKRTDAIGAIAVIQYGINRCF